MKTAKELFPECLSQEEELGFCSSPSSYQPIIDALGTVLVQVDDDNYSGDSRVFYEKDGKYGILIFGWGSCSGCDALQGCNSVAEIQNLMDGLVNDIRWFDSLGELKTYVSEKDWELEYSWNSDKTKDFVQKMLKYKKRGRATK